MATRSEQLVERLQKAMSGAGELAGAGELDIELDLDEVTLTVAADKLLEVCQQLHDLPDTAFVQMTDLCGVDYATYGSAEWSTDSEAGQGFSRAVDANSVGRLSFGADTDLPERELPRFAVVYHLLSLDHNCRLRVRCYCPDNDFPVVPSVTEIWSCADWYEREAFDMYGILFEGHNDLRRILTDYGFVGHPFRKDFPLVGNVEMRYDPEVGRVVYEPVSIEPRVLVPRVIRADNRYGGADAPEPEADKAESDKAKAG